MQPATPYFAPPPEDDDFPADAPPAASPSAPVARPPAAATTPAAPAPRPAGAAARQGVAQVVEGQVKLTIQIPNGKPAQTIYLNQIAGSVSYDANTGALIIQDLHGMGFTPDSRVKFALSGTQGIFAEKKKPEKEYREAQYQYTQTSTVKGRAPKKTGTK